MHDSMPILIGGGQFTQKEFSIEDAHPPLGIAAEASKQAILDAGIGDKLADHIDTIVSIRIFPDSFNRPRLQVPFGRAENPPRAVAERIGADPAIAIYGNVGGNTPQKYVNEMAERIANKEIDMALIAGSEAIRTAQTAMRNGVTLDWQEEHAGSLEDRGLGEALFTPHEFAHGIGVPIQTYPLFENALRYHKGLSIKKHMEGLGLLFENFSRIAESNPYSFYGTPRSAHELSTVTAENRWISFPYPKWMNAMDSVNQGAAVIMTSVKKAKDLGIDPAKWIFLHGCAEANEKINVTERVNYHSSPAIRVNAQKALDMAGLKLQDINYFDFYSCFPSAVQVACEELGLEYDDPRGLTVTGGLPFFGGPGNNYSMHAIATMLPMLRANPTHYALVTANGGYLSKHATGIYSAVPVAGRWERENPSKYQSEINRMKSPVFIEEPNGVGTVETYTICHKKGVPERGIVIGRIEGTDTRFLANTPNDANLFKKMMEEEQVGRKGTVCSTDGINTFTPI